MYTYKFKNNDNQLNKYKYYNLLVNNNDVYYILNQ